MAGTRYRCCASPFPSLAAVSCALAMGCGGGQTGDEHNAGPLRELRGTAQRLTASAALPNSAGDDGWSFAWRFYAEEADPAENVFFSPYSVSVASAMLIAGADGETKSEMQAALSFSSDGPAFHDARNAVSQALAARNRPGTEQVHAQTLRVSNDLWLRPDFLPATPFLDTLSAYYGASSYLAPFDTNPEAARLAINDKVAEDTEQLIQELLPPNSVDDAAFVLTNALYFKARWASEFPKSATTDEPFQAQSGASVDVPMMRTRINTAYVSSAEYDALALPYFGGELELVAIMPALGTFEAFSAALAGDEVEQIAASLERAELDLRFPKFSIDSEVPLKERLQALGMQQAFQQGVADFSAIAPNIYISGAFHQASLRLDEEGTEAAAATAIVGVPSSVPPPPIPVAFDHPFVFFIRDIETNAVLFVGHYANP